MPTRLAVLAFVAVLASAGAAGAQLGRVSCGSCGGALSMSPEMERLTGPYFYGGVGAVGGAFALSGAFGFGHQYPFGADFDATLGTNGQVLLTTTLRMVPIRLGLSAPWERIRPPPIGLVIALRTGFDVVLRSATRETLRPYLGADVELLFFGAFSLALRNGVAVDVNWLEPGAAPTVVPTVSLALGLVSPYAYDRDD